MSSISFARVYVYNTLNEGTTVLRNTQSSRHRHPVFVIVPVLPSPLLSLSREDRMDFQQIFVPPLQFFFPPPNRLGSIFPPLAPILEYQKLNMSLFFFFSLTILFVSLLNGLSSSLIRTTSSSSRPRRATRSRRRSYIFLPYPSIIPFFHSCPSRYSTHTKASRCFVYPLHTS